jgi:hypothetical protein
VLPVAELENARWTDRTRARAAAARRTLGGSLCLATLALAAAVGLAQAATLFAIHDILPSPPRIAAAAVILASLACLWVGTFAFVRLVTRRTGAVAATLTTLAFYGLALPFGTSDPLLTLLGLLPGALIAAPCLVRLPWPPAIARPRLPRPSP